MWWLLACQNELDNSSTPYEPGTTPWYRDDDGDGYGNPLGPKPAAEQPAGHVDNDLDCDDQDHDVRPDAKETCTGGDEDCDGLIDDADPDLIPDRTFWADPDGDGLGDVLAPIQACALPAGYVTNADDCSPEPLSVDWVDGIDDDCDGREDVQGEGQGTWWYATFPLERHARVGDTTLFLMNDLLYVLRDEDVDLRAPMLVFDETLPLGSGGSFAREGDHVWIRNQNALYRIDPTERGLSPLEGLALQSVALFQGYPFALGDFDDNELIEVATNAPLLASFELGPYSYDSLGEPIQISDLSAQQLDTVHFSSPQADDLLIVDFNGMWLLPEGAWDEPYQLYGWFVSHALGDMDGDGQQDLAICTGERVEVWLGAQLVDSPSDWTTPDLVTQQACTDVSLADVTGDGIDDLWISEEYRAVLAPGAAILPDVLVEQDWLLLLGEMSFEVLAADLDGDGHAELGSRGPLGWQWLSGVP